MTRLASLLSVAIVGLTSFAGLTAATGCIADNCARAVTGTAPNPSNPDVTSRREDCSSFFRVTETATAPTVEVTETIATITITVPYSPPDRRRRAAAVAAAAAAAAMKKRDPVVPYYASACSGAVRYSSACSCWGVVAATTTLPPATTVTVTASVTATATVTEAPPPPPPAEYIPCSEASSCGVVKYCPGGCYCDPSTEGGAFCNTAVGGCASFPSCSSSADCPSGSLCSNSNCCGRGLCLPFSQGNVCGNTVLPRAMFRPRGHGPSFRQGGGAADVAAPALAARDEVLADGDTWFRGVPPS